MAQGVQRSHYEVLENFGPWGGSAARTLMVAVKQLNIRTSRTFHLVDGRWRQIQHHGSIEDAKLFAEFQTAVRAAPTEPSLPTK
jgi:hypothetical protein